jgi:hypothetical protein
MKKSAKSDGAFLEGIRDALLEFNKDLESVRSYDLEKDPCEMVNRIEDADIHRDLRVRYQDWMLDMQNLIGYCY